MDDPLDGIGFNDREFFEEQRSADWRWLLPVSLAIAVHVAFFAGALYLPGIIRHRPLLDEVVTVDLVSLPEPAKAPPAPSPPVRKAEPVAPKKTTRPVIPPEPAPVAATPVPEVKPEPAASARPVSIRPLKRKIRKARDTRLAEEKERQRLAREARERQRREAVRRQELARAREAERKAEEARRRAVAELAALIRTSDAAAPSTRRNSSSGGRQVRSIVFKQYLSALYDRVHSYWVLPEMRQWDPGLEAVVVLTIGRDGTVLRTTMEKRSRDPFFDRFVMKTIQNASPMPRFSKLMPDKTIEVGLRFRPGELSM
ncbi:TonB C-terminal domain-containing protein [Thermodesulfobacteriota bacterium B35]